MAETDDTKDAKGTPATNEEFEEENPVVPAGYIPGNTGSAGGTAVVDGEVVVFDSEGNEVGHLGQGGDAPVEEDA